MISTIDTSVIIVNNDHRQYIQKCISSVMQQINSTKIEIILVDNASGDGSVEYVKTHFLSIKTINQTFKHGFAANNNKAILESNGKYVLLLNPDTEMKPGSLIKLIEFMDNHKDVGVCGPKLRFPNGELQYSCRRFPTSLTFLTRRTPLRFFTKNSWVDSQHLMMDFDHNHVQEVDWLLGACMMIRRQVFADIGYLDEHFYIYLEDVDFCLRAHQYGWKVCYVPDAEVIHHHLSVSDHKIISIHSLHHLRSSLYFAIKHNNYFLFKKSINKLYTE